MNQIGFNNTANIETYNDVARDQINNYTVVVENREQVDIAAIRSLRIAENPSGNQHQTCTENTRVQILQDIHEWADDATTSNQIFWIADRAGTGKSTVAKQIAKDWERASKPVASFFFSINAADTSSNTKICPTIAAKLAELHDFGSFRSMLTKALRRKLTVETLNFNDQFQELLITPLKKTNRPVLIIIDALDECDKKDRFELLSVLLDQLNKLPMVKVLITSRPEPDIFKLLQREILVRSSDLRGSSDNDSTIQDILQYVSQFFAHSDKLRNVKSHALKLAKASNGIFIYASTACKYLEDSLDLDAALATMDNISGLDDLYSQIMERAIPKNDAVSLQAVHSILQIIIAAQRPLSISEMQKLLKKDKAVQSVVEALVSVLSSGAEDTPVEILHPTFQEYLTERDRSGEYFVDVRKGHESLAISCLEACSAKSLTFSNEVPRAITSTLGYAVLYWAIHAAIFLKAENAQEDVLSLEDRILSLFKKDLIHWFELIVLLEAVYQCIKHLAILETSTTVPFATATDPTSRVYECMRWCRDSQRFLQHHQPAIEQGSIHIRPVLAFTPSGSLIYKAYFATHAWQIPHVLCGIPIEWPSHRTLSGHTSFVTCVAFSPDGARIVSSSDDSTLRLWDGVTGAAIGGPMNGHTQPVASVSFSPDGARIISGSWDRTLRLWDGVTGASIGEPMKGHSWRVINVAFSPDGTHIVSGSWDKTLRLWDGVTGACIGEPMKGHAKEITSIAFSPDGTRIASGSEDWTLRLWDGVTGTSVGGPMKGHTNTVTYVSFSPDGTRIISGSWDNTLWLWDSVTCTSISGPMKGHTHRVNVVIFSPDGSRVVSGSWDNTLRLWDGVTGARIGRSMSGHTGAVACVAFSPGGAHILSGSYDSTLRLWDGVTGARIGRPMNGHTSVINNVAFSPDNSHVVSGSYDSTLRLWDGVTETSISEPMIGHASRVNSVSISPDGTRVVSGSDDNTLRLWDGMTGGSIGGPMKGHTHRVNIVIFSPDSKRIVSGSWDNELRLWDGKTGASIGWPMKGHIGWVTAVAFSPDGNSIVSGSGDATIRLWNGVTGASLGEPANKDSTEIQSLVFSPDGNHIASSSEDHVVRLWRLSSSYVPFGLWRVSSLAEVAVTRTDFVVTQVKFSTCGSYLVVDDRHWDTRSLPFSLAIGTNPEVLIQSSSPLRYNHKSRMIEILTSSVFTFPITGCQVHTWVAQGGRIALGLKDGRVVIIDCTHLL